MMRFICLTIFATVSFQVFSGTADLILESSFIEDYDLTRGEIVKFTMTITNNGPDTAGGDSTGSHPIFVTTSGISLDEDGLDVLFFLDESIPQNCNFGAGIGEPLPGEFPQFFYGYYHPPLESNQSSSCYGEFQIMNSTEVEIGVISSMDVDPVDSNNSLNMILGIRPEPVPSLSTRSIILMTLLMMVVAGISLIFKSIQR